MSECACYRAIWGDLLQYVPHYKKMYDVRCFKGIFYWKVKKEI